MTIEEALNRYHKKIYDLIYYNIDGDKQEADDYTNDVFSVMIEKWHRINNEAVYSWLLSTTNKKLKEYNRIKQRENRIITLDEMVIVPGDSTDMEDLIISDKDIEQKKDELLAMLSEEERILYEDCFVSKIGYKEVAEKLGIKYNAVSARAVKLRKKIEREVYKSFAVSGTATALRLIVMLFYNE